MKYVGALPWVITLAASLGCTYEAIQLAQARTKLQVAYANHSDARQFDIRRQLSEVSEPIVILGDSITEWAHFPREACGHPIVNAGIRGARAWDFLYRAPAILWGHPRKAALIVVTLGANEKDGVQDYPALFQLLGDTSNKLAAVSDTNRTEINSVIEAAAKAAGIPFATVAMGPADHGPDGVHFSERGYAVWLPAITATIQDSLPECQRVEGRPS